MQLLNGPRRSRHRLRLRPRTRHRPVLPGPRAPTLALFEYDESKVATLRDEFGDDVLVVQGDVRSIADLTRCRDEIVGRFGRLTAHRWEPRHLRRQRAVGRHPGGRVDTLLDEVFAVNVKGYVLTARIFLDLLEAEEGLSC